MAAFLLLVRGHWKLVGLGLLLLALAVQSVRLGSAKNEIERQKIANNELRAELKSISDRKNEQRETTKQNITRADEGNRKADEIARRIEEAPVPGNCQTPPEIMGADL